jgi:hypothetical protein
VIRRPTAATIALSCDRCGLVLASNGTTPTRLRDDARVCGWLYRPWGRVGRDYCPGCAGVIESREAIRRKRR